MPVDRKAQLMVTTLFRHLTDAEKDELVDLLIADPERTDARS